MTGQRYDLIVIGAGPGGYTAAIRAAQLGFSVACVDKRASWGGTCLNVGCIPSKALLESTERYVEARDHLGDHGIGIEGLSFDLPRMLARKDRVVEDLTKGIAFLFRKNGIDGISGRARIVRPGRIEIDPVDGTGGPKVLECDRILVATGSEPAELDGLDVDETRILSSTGALDLRAVPGHLIVVGGGYIGLELGSVWQRLGAKVTVVEYLDRILPAMDGEIAGQMARVLERQGMTFRTATKVTGAEERDGSMRVALDPVGGGAGAGETVECDAVLVAVGRRPFTDGLGLDAVGVERDARGFVSVDRRFETGVKGIFAVGDAIPGPMLAHKAEEEGIAAVETMAGQAGHIDYDAIPGVVYTAPEAASVGKTEEALNEEGRPVKVGRFPFSANARARGKGVGDGFVKIVADARTDAVLGAHIVGPEAGTMIAELALAIEFGASSEDIARTCHAHPTLNEAIKEAALAVEGRQIHL